MSFSSVSILTAVLGQWYRSYLWLCARQPQKGCVLQCQQHSLSCCEQRGKIRFASIRQALNLPKVPYQLWLMDFHGLLYIGTNLCKDVSRLQNLHVFPMYPWLSEVSWPKWAFPAFTMPGPPANIGVEPKVCANLETCSGLLRSWQSLQFDWLLSLKFWVTSYSDKRSFMQRNRHAHFFLLNYAWGR